MMRQSVRSSGSSGASSTACRRSVQVVLLNRDELTVFIEGKARVQDVFNQACEHLGLREVDYFGLSLLIEGEYQFQKLETKLHKLAPKLWKNKASTDQPVLTFYFRVQYYVENITLLRERVTRSLYYLQLRDNLLNHSQSMSEEKCFLIAAYALQADYGDYVSRKATPPYFDPREYFPAWVVDRHGDNYILQHTPTLHADLRGQTKMDAQLHFIRDVSVSPIAHSLHFYKLKKKKTDELGSIWMGICARGIEIYEVLDYNSLKSLLMTFSWTEIEKLHHDKKKFELSTKDKRKFIYYTGSDDRSKYLFTLSQATHLFHMSMQPKLAEIRHMEETDKRYRENYVFCENSDSFEHERSSVHSRSSMHRAVSGGRHSPRSRQQRFSMISSISSNTTSGIVSDRHHASLDDSEEDSSREIMITSPPMPQPVPWGSVVYSPPSYALRSPTPALPLMKPLGSHASVSRSSSGHSQKSAKLPMQPLGGAVMSPLASTPTRLSFNKEPKSNILGYGSAVMNNMVPVTTDAPSPIAAKTQIQRSAMPQAMMVNSRSVNTPVTRGDSTSSQNSRGYSGNASPSLPRINSTHAVNRALNEMNQHWDLPVPEGFQQLRGVPSNHQLLTQQPSTGSQRGCSLDHYAYAQQLQAQQQQQLNQQHLNHQQLNQQQLNQQLLQQHVQTPVTPQTHNPDLHYQEELAATLALQVTQAAQFPAHNQVIATHSAHSQYRTPQVEQLAAIVAQTAPSSSQLPLPSVTIPSTQGAVGIANEDSAVTQGLQQPITAQYQVGGHCVVLVPHTPQVMPVTMTQPQVANAKMVQTINAQQPQRSGSATGQMTARVTPIPVSQGHQQQAQQQHAKLAQLQSQQVSQLPVASMSQVQQKVGQPQGHAILQQPVQGVSSHPEATTVPPSQLPQSVLQQVPKQPQQMSKQQIQSVPAILQEVQVPTTQLQSTPQVITQDTVTAALPYEQEKQQGEIPVHSHLATDLEEKVLPETQDASHDLSKELDDLSKLKLQRQEELEKNQRKQEELMQFLMQQQQQQQDEEEKIKQQQQQQQLQKLQEQKLQQQRLQYEQQLQQERQRKQEYEKLKEQQRQQELEKLREQQRQQELENLREHQRQQELEKLRQQQELEQLKQLQRQQEYDQMQEYTRIREYEQQRQHEYLQQEYQKLQAEQKLRQEHHDYQQLLHRQALIQLQDPGYQERHSQQQQHQDYEQLQQLHHQMLQENVRESQQRDYMHLLEYTLNQQQQQQSQAQQLAEYTTDMQLYQHPESLQPYHESTISTVQLQQGMPLQPVPDDLVQNEHTLQEKELPLQQRINQIEQQEKELVQRLQQLQLQEQTSNAALGEPTGCLPQQQREDVAYQQSASADLPQYQAQAYSAGDIGEEWQQLSTAAAMHEAHEAELQQGSAYTYGGSSGSGDSAHVPGVEQQYAELLKQQSLLRSTETDMYEWPHQQHLYTGNVHGHNGYYQVNQQSQYMMPETRGSVESLDHIGHQGYHGYAYKPEAPVKDQRLYLASDMAIPDLVRPEDSTTQEIVAPPYAFQSAEGKSDYELPSNTGFMQGQDPASVYAALNNVVNYGVPYPESSVLQSQAPQAYGTHTEDLQPAPHPPQYVNSDGPKLPSYLEKQKSKTGQWNGREPARLNGAGVYGQSDEENHLNSTMLVSGEELETMVINDLSAIAAASPAAEHRENPAELKNKENVDPGDDKLMLVNVPKGRKWCPLHSRTHIDEVRAKNASMPMLNALLNAKDLHQCRCNDEIDEKRKSYAHPVPERMWNEPGTVVRPMSWHCGNFSPEQTMKAFRELNIGEAKSLGSPFIGSEVGDVHVNGLDMTALTGKSGMGSSSRMDGPMGSPSLVPPRLHSGGHSPNNSDSVPTQQQSLGVA